MSTRPVRRVGVTMRVDGTAPHGEVRDALARDWDAFLAAALPEVVWAPLPNVGNRVIPLIEALELDAFILSGGNDIGSVEARDRTETAILSQALERRLPVFGVCRGMQMIQHFFGGALQRCDEAVHVAARHPVRLHADGADGTRVVNSFHRFGIRCAALAGALIPTAEADDGWVEGAQHRKLPIAGVMWHPEREPDCPAADRAILRSTFGMDEI